MRNTLNLDFGTWCSNAELLIQDAQHNAAVMVARVASLEKGTPFQAPQRPPPPEPSERRDAAGLSRLIGNTVITEKLVDFSNTEVRFVERYVECTFSGWPVNTCVRYESAASNAGFEQLNINTMRNSHTTCKYVRQSL